MLTFGHHRFADDQPLVMAIINRTPDSFYDRGATYAHDAALERVQQVVEQGAQIIDIGGVKAGPGQVVDPQEEKRRVVSFVAEVASQHPQVVISVDTWRADVGRAVVAEGATLLNDAWGAHDPQLAEVAAEHGVGLLKKDYLHYSRSETEIAIMRQIRRAFDPLGIMNPGKVFD